MELISLLSDLTGGKGDGTAEDWTNLLDHGELCHINEMSLQKQVLSAHSILRILGSITQPVYMLQAQNFDIIMSDQA